MSTTEKLETRRKETLFKKASHLSVLCDAEVAIIAFTRDGKLHEFSSTSMDHTLSRYTGTAEQPKTKKRRRHEPEKLEEPKPCQESHVLEDLKGQHAALSLEKSRRIGRELDALSREDLRALEEQQLRALLAVNNKKKEQIEEMLQRSMLHNEKRAQQVKDKNLIIGLEERPYVLQEHGPTGKVLARKSDAVSFCNCLSEDFDEHSELLQLRL